MLLRTRFVFPRVFWRWTTEDHGATTRHRHFFRIFQEKRKITSHNNGIPVLFPNRHRRCVTRAPRDGSADETNRETLRSNRATQCKSDTLVFYLTRVPVVKGMPNKWPSRRRGFPQKMYNIVLWRRWCVFSPDRWKNCLDYDKNKFPWI